jgi:hypothetical protein
VARDPDSTSDLPPDEWERLQRFIDRFETAWRRTNSPSEVIDLADFLPPAADPLRPAALCELVKSDLEIRWRYGQGLRLEDYAKRFPEMGGAGGLMPPLIYEEYRVRQRFGDRPSLTAYRERFPGQFEEFQRLVKEQPVPPAPTPPPSATPSAERAPEFRPAGDQLLQVGGGYRLLERLNRGSFGEVWRAEAPGGVEVALKLIFGTVEEKQARRELAALDLIKRLRHPYLLAIHAYFQQAERLVVVTELADGSLRDHDQERRRACEPGLPLGDLLRYLGEGAEALDFLHARQVLHRDIKPENILLLAGHAKVADFGLSRLFEQTRRTGAVSQCGTPAYTAPEVFWRGQVGPGSDQYSLAATYAELRLNRPLFPTKNWLQLMQDHLQRQPDLMPLLPPEQQVIRKALAKEPAERYPNCRDFARALERAVPH